MENAQISREMGADGAGDNTADYRIVDAEWQPIRDRKPPEENVLDLIHREVFGINEIQGSSNPEWQPPISLESAQLPAWPNDVFSVDIQSFVTALSESTETPPELSTMMVLAAISACAQGKYRVCVKTDYHEPVNVWVAAALPPGSRKTAVQSAATAPISKWENLQREKLEPTIKKATANRATITEQINTMRKMASKLTGTEFDRAKEEIAAIEANLPEIPTAPQIWAQDVTPENLGAIMSENNARMAILSDESGIFDTLGGRYSGGLPNLDLFLQSHAGSAVRVNRGSRPPVFMSEPCLTLGLSPQPDVLRGLSEKPGFRGRGLLARFLYVLPKSNLGYRTLNAQPMLGDWRARYEGILLSILSQPMAGTDDEPLPHILKIADSAKEQWHSFALRVECDMRDGGRFEHMTDWSGKLPGAVIRIAALLHIARHAFVKPWEKEIAIEDMSAALRLADALSVHAIVTFDLMNCDPIIDGARHILKWITRNGEPEITFRDIHYANKSRYKKAAEIAPIVDLLVDRGYLKRLIQSQTAAGRPGKSFLVNPAAFDD